jgi:hypothetical protein
MIVEWISLRSAGSACFSDWSRINRRREKTAQCSAYEKRESRMNTDTYLPVLEYIQSVIRRSVDASPMVPMNYNNLPNTPLAVLFAASFIAAFLAWVR